MNQDFIKSDHTIQSNSDFLDESSKYRYLSTSQSICFISLKISAQNDLDSSERSFAPGISGMAERFCVFRRRPEDESIPCFGIRGLVHHQHQDIFHQRSQALFPQTPEILAVCFLEQVEVGTWQKPSICNVWYCAFYSCSVKWVLLKVLEGAH